MDDSKPKKLVVLSLFIGVLTIVLFRDITNKIDNSFFKEKYVLVIGILSAPENFHRRLSVRNTWLNLISDISSTYYFLIGEEICKIHPLDRVSNQSCIENLFSLPANVTSETEFTTLKRRKKTGKSQTPILNSIGFGFRVLSDIRVKKLGIIKGALQHFESGVRVKLISAYGKNVLASVTIGRYGSLTDKSDFILKSINSVFLPRNFEAQIVMEGARKTKSLLPSCEAMEWSTTPGVISYLQILQPGDKKPWPFRTNSCSHVLMNYVVSDVSVLKEHIDGRTRRKKEWRDARKNLILQLKNESDMYRDILFLDVTDVYQNLPRKLVYFFKKLMATVYFHYVLKTDDDSFIDVPRVYNQLLSVSKEIDEEIMLGLNQAANAGLVVSIRLAKFWWWSNFREFWKVQETGKWRDDKYRSPAYPSFPCGGGYVLNRGIVDYLSENSKNLQYFQGEDVSIGIWMSGLDTIQHKTPKVSRFHDIPSHEIQQKVIFSYGGEAARSKYFTSLRLNRSKMVPDICDWTCDNTREYDIPICNKVQQNEAEMYDAWNKYVKQGYI